MEAASSTEQRIRKALRIHLLRRGITLGGLAERLGLHKVYLCQVLSGNRRGAPTRKRLIEELNIPASLLRYRRKRKVTGATAPSPNAQGMILTAETASEPAPADGREELFDEIGADRLE